MISKKLQVLLLIALTALPLSAMQDLSKENCSWSAVSGGKFVIKPETTSYGITGVLDGRTIISVSDSGTVLWEKPFGADKNSLISTVSDDFTVAVTSLSRKITLINPSGLPLWSKVLDYEVTEKPFEGRDGRFFLRGKNNLSCYGINGICKWEITTEEQNSIPLQELPDGSLVIFLKNTDGGKTKALRISPFGRTLEEITFAGEVVSSATCRDGVLLVFSDGSAGLFSLEENKAVNKFVISSKAFRSNKENFFVADRFSSSVFFVTQNSSSIKAFSVNTESGELPVEILVPDMLIKNLTECRISGDAFFISDSKTAYFFNSKGICLWNAKLPERTKTTKWNFALLNGNNTLLLCNENWSLDAYVVSQKASSHKSRNELTGYPDYFKADSSVYGTIYLQTFDRNFTSEERIRELRNGKYGEKEISYTSEFLSAIKAYNQYNASSNFGARTETPVFKTDSAGFERILIQFPFYGSKEISALWAGALEKETNITFLNTLISGIQKNAYDPEEKIMEALLSVSASLSPRNSSTAEEICDAVYALCRFMGRPAYHKCAKTILSNFMYPTYSQKVRTKARDTLKKIVELNI